MYRLASVCLCACTVASFAASTAAQVLSRNNSGLTTPEAYLALSNGKTGPVPFDGFLSSLSAQDVDGDGKTDLLVTGIPSDSNLQGPITTTLLRNTGSGTFQQVRGNNPDYCIPAPSLWGPMDRVAPFCTSADLNGDGRPDKIWAVEYSNAANANEVDYPTIKVQFATGGGTYSAPQRYVLGGRNAFIAAVAMGDFNGDGRQDIAVLRMSQLPDPATQRFYAYVIVLLGNSQGGFTPTHAYSTGVYDSGSNGEPPFGRFDLQLIALDLNGDGKSDLVVYPAPSPLFIPVPVTSPYAVLLGRADGLTLEVSSVPCPFLLLAPADLNHDAFGDLLAAEADGLHLLYGAGGHSPIYGFFGRDIKLSLGESGANIMTMVATDLNGDGLPDIMADTGNAVSLFFQKGDGSFADAKQYAGGSSSGAVLADINNDGHPDIVLEGDPLSILYGDGKGSFTGSPQTVNGYGGTPVTADFNRDGNPDVATVSSLSAGNKVNVFMGTGKGWFNPPKSYAVPNLYCLLAAGDVNGDGIPDLVIENALPPSAAGQSGPDTSVLFGRKDGTFTPPSSSYVGLGDVRGTQDVFLADVNKDGHLDLITDAGVALGKGDGTFGSPIAFPIPANANPNFTSIAVADVNGSGLPDVLLGSSGSVTVLLNDGTGHFNPGQVIDPGCGSDCLPFVAAGKLDANSSIDLVVAFVDSTGITDVVTYTNDGKGTFTERQRLALSEPYFALYNDSLIAVAIADLTGDGRNDIIVQAGPLGVLPGNGDGTVGEPIAFEYSFGVFGSDAFAIADFNKDGYLDLVMPGGTGFGRLLNTGPKSWVSKP